MIAAAEYVIRDSAEAVPATGLMALFVRQLLPRHEAARVLSGLYTDALHDALLQQLAALRCDNPAVTQLRPLPKWRLDRLCQFIDSNIENAISLPEMAAVVGLSRMHFAAQFRMATGLRPHDFVARRRISIAAKLLGDPARPIVDVALSVGFQNQSHFTTVFTRHMGVPPSRWRKLQRDEPQPGRYGALRSPEFRRLEAAQ